jgi:benzoate membrane transport protein
VLVGLLALVFGALAPLFVRLLLATPPAFIAALGGLAMLRVLQTAFGVAFGGKFAFGALVTFLVTVADVTIFNIGAVLGAGVRPRGVLAARAARPAVVLEGRAAEQA